MGCLRLKIAGPSSRVLRREIESIAVHRREGVLKLIVTRGLGRRGYGPTGREHCTRILALHPLPRGVLGGGSTPARVRLCATPLGLNPRLAGLKTLNRLESVVARSEWNNGRIWEGLMRDVDENVVCGTMSNLFLRSGSNLMTPVLDRCGVAGVFMSNAVIGLRSVAVIESGRERLRYSAFETANRLRERLDLL